MIIKVKSPAKINLTLEIIKRLPNGFHALRSVMMKSDDLYDEIEIKFSEKGEGIKIFCSDKNIPTDEKNICWKISESFFEESGKRAGLVIKIGKNIPAGSGLGGGSSNGASVLLALNDYFGKPFSEKRLIEIAARVGKDIPFFIQKEKVAYVSGMGEKLEAVKKFPKFVLLVVNPNGEIPTPLAYKELDEKLWFMADKNRKNISRLAVSAKNSREIAGLLYNDFDLVAKEKFPEVEILEKTMVSLGASGASISGKGPTVFGIFKNKKEALKVKNIIKKKYPRFFVEIA